MTRLFVLMTLLMAGLASAEAPVQVRRLALLVGVNDGGPGRDKLRYAATDAQAFAKVLGELGGVSPADRVLLLDTGRTGLMEGFAKMKALTESARASGANRVEVLLYYSGHSDDEGLLLQGERVDYGELRKALGGLTADVRIAVLDSCASGAFARAQGRHLAARVPGGCGQPGEGPGHPHLVERGRGLAGVGPAGRLVLHAPPGLGAARVRRT